jgi:rhodanese-related sulfurtransferase|tara:strand:+ start:4426 stop:4842 length:417 start_codon:yes stop_codon:yes gene_type:complete
MVDQLFEFVVNHYMLVSIFVVLLIAVVINENRQGGATVTPANLVKLINHEEAVVLDIRDQKEFKEGHIVNAVNIPYASMNDSVHELEKFKERKLVIVCKMGQHSGAVGKKLRGLGFAEVQRLSGGISEWRASNLPLVK